MSSPELRDPAPERVTVEFDHHSADFCARNYEITDDLRARCPVAYTEAHGGYWVLTGYEPVAAALLDDELFSSKPSVGIPASPIPAPLLPIESDPPLTRELRAIIARHFTVNAVRALTPAIREMAGELIDKFIERGECDIAAELATPLPARTILAMLGFDDNRWPEWVDCVHFLMHDRTTDPEKTLQVAGTLFAGIAEEVARREMDGFEPAQEDVLSSIMRGTVQGRPLEPLEVSMYTFTLFLAGMDTTSGLVGNALVRLDQQPALRERLLADRSLLPAATDEFLRHDTSVQGLARTVTRDADFFGQRLRAGDRVLLMFAAANRDPAAFDRPGEIDFDRRRVKDLAFGVGEHRCLGANLASVLFQVMIDEILTRLPDFRVTGPGERFPDAGETYALRHLPIAFTPGRRRAPAPAEKPATV
jgi:cytochrome P450